MPKPPVERRWEGHEAGIPITARLWPEAHAKLMRHAQALGGRRGDITDALNALILDAPEPKARGDLIV